jgi:hypothetical protein
LSKWPIYPFLEQIKSALTVFNILGIIWKGVMVGQLLSIPSYPITALVVDWVLPGYLLRYRIPQYNVERSVLSSQSICSLITLDKAQDQALGLLDPGALGL